MLLLRGGRRSSAAGEPSEAVETGLLPLIFVLLLLAGSNDSLAAPALLSDLAAAEATSGIAPFTILIVAAALLALLALRTHMIQNRAKCAMRGLANYAHSLKADEAAHWSDTKFLEIDDVAQSLGALDREIRAKSVQLKELEDRIGRFLDSATHCGIMEVFEDGRIALPSGCVKSFLDIGDRAVIGAHRDSVTQEASCECAHAFAPKDEKTQTLVTESGRRLIISANTRFSTSAKGAVAGALAAFSDVTNRLDAEKSQRQFEARLRSIIDALPVGVVLAEAPSGRIVEGNRAVEAILRRPVVHSSSTDSHREWISFHDNGRPVESGDYPLARALAGEERPALECNCQRGDGSRAWIKVTAAPLRNDRGEIIGAIGAVTDIDEIKAAQARERAMNLELHHRVNNTLAVIQGVASITARAATDIDSFRQDFSERILCLSRISTLLVKNSWERTFLADVIQVALFNDSGASPDRIVFSGQDIPLRSSVALALGVALHELKMNAERFGALSTPRGRVTLEWRCLDDNSQKRLTFNWIESGGPSVTPPTRYGVGSHLMKCALSRQLNGDIELAYEPAGLRAAITAEI